MKKYFYLLLIFLTLFCTKKKVDLVFLPEKNTENIENRNFAVAFSRFEDDYYFWSELENFQNASLFFVDLKDKNGKKLSGKYTISYGIYDDILEDAIIPNTLTTETLSFFEGSSAFSIDLSDLLTRGKFQNREAWFWFEFIFYDKNNVEVARIKIGTLIKKEREFTIDIIDVYSFENALHQVEIELDISDPLFQLPPKTLAPNFYVKFNDEIPKLYNFKADYSENKAYLTLTKDEIPELNSELRLLIWHQIGEVSLAASSFIGLSHVYFSKICKRVTEAELLQTHPFNLDYDFNAGQVTFPVTKLSLGKLTVVTLGGGFSIPLPTTPVEPATIGFGAVGELPPTIECFTQLRYLSLSGVEKLPDNMHHLYHLEHLNIERSTLKELPNNFSQLAHLETFTITAALEKLPHNFGQLKKLKQLILNKTAFDEFPKELLQLPQLQDLALQNTSFTVLPSDIYLLKNLIHLNLRNNQFYTLPETLKNMQQLKFLDVYSNALVLVGQNKTIKFTTSQLQSLNVLSSKCPVYHLLTDYTYKNTSYYTPCGSNGECIKKQYTYTLTCSETWENRTKQWLPNTQVIIKNTL